MSDVLEVMAKPEVTEAQTRERGPRGQVVIFGTWCKGCGLCVAFCPTEVLALDAKVIPSSSRRRNVLPVIGAILIAPISPSSSSGSRGDELTVKLMQGNEAVAWGALAAGCMFYAGYPITPSTEIAEMLSRELPKIGGKFIQMEDEIASLAACIGASVGGLKAMTATSGPGFSLMQEHIGYAAMTEVPCVVVDVQRLGPSTGQATSPAQGDVMQARWGTHGDLPSSRSALPRSASRSTSP